MSFTNTVSPSQAIGGVIGLIVIGLGVRFLLAGGIEEYFNPNKRVENRIVAVLEKRPGDLALMRAMEEYFPLDYDNFLDTMTAAATSGREEDVIRDGSAFIARFIAGHDQDFRNAPDALLIEVADSESRLLASLSAKSKIDCADYVFGTLQPEIPLSADTNRLLGEAAAAKIKAISGGRTQQTVRLGVTPTVGKALVDTMRARGASERQLAAMRGEIDPETLPVDEQCDVGMHMVEAIRAQPPGTAALLTGDLLMPVL